MTEIQAPKGVPVYFPPRSQAFLRVREALSAPAEHAGYEYAELPVFEDTALYVRGVGESTDVVSKEMYTFEDRGGRSLSLRPEGTAGVMRLVIEHRLDKGQLPVKLWYAGPFFGLNVRSWAAIASCSRLGSRQSAWMIPRWMPKWWRLQTTRINDSDFRGTCCT